MRKSHNTHTHTTVKPLVCCKALCTSPDVCACVFVGPCVSLAGLCRKDLIQVLPVTTADAHVSCALPTRLKDCRCLRVCVWMYVCAHVHARHPLAGLNAPVRSPGTRVMCAGVFAQQSDCVNPSKLAVLLPGQERDANWKCFTGSSSTRSSLIVFRCCLSPENFF